MEALAEDFADEMAAAERPAATPLANPIRPDMGIQNAEWRLAAEGGPRLQTAQAARARQPFADEITQAQNLARQSENEMQQHDASLRRFGDPNYVVEPMDPRTGERIETMDPDEERELRRSQIQSTTDNYNRARDQRDAQESRIQDLVRLQDAHRRLAAARALSSLSPDLAQLTIAGNGMVYGGRHDSYGETLAGGSFWHSLGQDFKKATHWMGNHLGEIGGAALIGAQFIPGVDAVVDAGTAADLAATSADTAETAETADAAEGASKASKVTKRFKNPIRRGIYKVGHYGGMGAAVAGQVIGDGGPPPGQPPPPPPPNAPPPNLVGEYSAPSGNPYLN